MNFICFAIYLAIGILMVGFVQAYDRWQCGAWYWERSNVTPAVIAFNVLAALFWPLGMVVAIGAVPIILILALVEGLCSFFSASFWHKTIIKKRPRVSR